MKIIVHGPAAGPGPDGMIQSWAPDQAVDIDDGDKQAVAWVRTYASTYLVTVGEDVAPKAPAKPSGRRA